MPEEIVMPRLSDTMEEGTIARWLKHEGEPVHKGEPIMEVETDKATMELPAYSDGVLQKILVSEGGTAPVGAPIGVLVRQGEQAGDGAGAAGRGGSGSSAAAAGAEPDGRAAPNGTTEAERAGAWAAATQAEPGTEPGAPLAAEAERSSEAGAPPAAVEASQAAEASHAESPRQPKDRRGAQPTPSRAAPASAKAAPSDAAAAPDDARAEELPREREQASGANGTAREAPPDQSPGQPPRQAASSRPPAAADQANGSARQAAAPEPPIRATPVARRLAEEHHLDLAVLAGQGSGPGGRIVQLDVERYVEAAASGAGAPAAEPAREQSAAPVEAAGQAPPAPAESPPPVAPETDVERRSVSRVHRLMAEHTLQSVREIPHYYLTVEIDVGAALELRRQLADSLGEEGKVSINDLLLRAVALALRTVPEVNSRWEDGQLLVYRRVHLGLAVAVPDGLVVPVIRDADQKTLRQIAAEAGDLAGRARAGKLTAAEVQSSTFTLTNLGMYGVEEIQGVINAPEAGLLAVGAVVEKPVGWEGQIVLRPRLRATLAADHRAYSGDVGARFLQALVRLLQEPLRLGF
jgi:pyruvate dehydrogenase E2 component (dihydrolipoyllysine-residue acetyltransferase)